MTLRWTPASYCWALHQRPNRIGSGYVGIQEPNTTPVWCCSGTQCNNVVKVQCGRSASPTPSCLTIASWLSSPGHSMLDSGESRVAATLTCGLISSVGLINSPRPFALLMQTSTAGGAHVPPCGQSLEQPQITPASAPHKQCCFLLCVMQSNFCSLADHAPLQMLPGLHAPSSRA